MRLLLPIYVAVLHIAGDNVAVIPDLAVEAGPGIYSVIIYAYLVFGVAIAGILSWIGFTTGKELTVTTRRLLGCRGKIVLGILLLAVCLPASALTGGIYSGWAVYCLTGIPYTAAVPICLILFALLAAGYGDAFLKISNFAAFFFIPIVLWMLAFTPITLPDSCIDSKTDWMLVFAFIGYNTCGMHSVLQVETAACLAKNHIKAQFITVASKLFEGLLTLSVAYLVLANQATGPLSFVSAAKQYFGHEGIFYFILFCIFTNYMAPAIMLNTRQLAMLTGKGFTYCLAVIVICIYAVTFLPIRIILYFMSVSGIVMLLYIILIAAVLYHRQKSNRFNK